MATKRPSIGRYNAQMSFLRYLLLITFRDAYRCGINKPTVVKLRGGKNGARDKARQSRVGKQKQELHRWVQTKSFQKICHHLGYEYSEVEKLVREVFHGQHNDRLEPIIQELQTGVLHLCPNRNEARKKRA